MWPPVRLGLASAPAAADSAEPLPDDGKQLAVFGGVVLEPEAQRLLERELAAFDAEPAHQQRRVEALAIGAPLVARYLDRVEWLRQSA